MLTEVGVVEKVFGERASVLIQRSGACAHCDSTGSCNVADEKTMHTVLSNELRAKVGDQVQLTFSSHSFLKLSFLVYFLPVVALVAGASLGEAWGPFSQVTSTAGSITGGSRVSSVPMSS